MRRRPAGGTPSPGPNTRTKGMPGVPGSHHPQFIDVAHREHAVVETAGVRTARAMGLRNLPSKSWQVNCGWVLAANIAADLAAWCRLLGLCDHPDLRDAAPETLRYRIWHIPARLARLARHARERILKISPDWPWKDALTAGTGSSWPSSSTRERAGHCRGRGARRPPRW